MSQLLHLMKWDFILLYRNQLVLVSAVVTGLYIGAFNALKAIGDVEKILVMIIFNDPALLGFIFIGVSVLFEKSENTLEALVVTPASASNYVLSKTLVLSLISLACCLVLAFTVKQFNFNWLHLIAASLLTTSLFGLMGFILVSSIKSINEFILKAAGLFMLMGLPFLQYFNVIESNIFYFIPSAPAIDLFNAAFQNVGNNQILLAYGFLIGWNLFLFQIAVRSFNKNLKK